MLIVPLREIIEPASLVDQAVALGIPARRWEEIKTSIDFRLATRPHEYINVEVSPPCTHCGAILGKIGVYPFMLEFTASNDRITYELIRR